MLLLAQKLEASWKVALCMLFAVVLDFNNPWNHLYTYVREAYLSLAITQMFVSNDGRTVVKELGKLPP